MRPIVLFACSIVFAAYADLASAGVPSMLETDTIKIYGRLIRLEALGPEEPGKSRTRSTCADCRYGIGRRSGLVRPPARPRD